MTKRQAIVLGVAVLLILLLFFGLRGCNDDKPKEAGKKQPKQTENLRTVSVKQARFADVKTAFKEYGRVVNAQPLEIAAEVSGRLMPGVVSLRSAVPFREGQILFQIDSKEQRLALQSNKSDFLQQVAAILPDIKLDYTDEYDKWNTFFKAIDVNDKLPQMPPFATPKERTFVATQNLLKTYYNIQSAEARLDKHVYVAPYSGSIAEAYAQPGTNVSPGTPVLKLIRTDQLEVELPVKVEEIGNIQLGQQVTLQLKNAAMSWQSRVSRISDYVDPETQSVNVYLSVVANGKQKLYEGQYLEADLPGRKVENVIELPRKAVTGEREVWVVKNSKLAKQEVEVAAVRPNSVLISGVKEGTLILTDPGVSAQAGETVKTELAK